MIKVWDFDFNAVPGKATPDYGDQEVIQRAFDHNMDLMVSLERRGFEGVFYSEHHFVQSLSPCPNLLIAALAARTNRLKIGVMGNVLPFHQPWRLAEELAMLDYLTHGRLEIGVASGVPPEFLFVGIPQPDVRPMYAEILDFLQKSEEQRYVTHKGKYFDLEEVPIMPRPRKEARRRHWMTIYSEASCRDAARRDFKVCTGFQSVESASKAFDGYRDEAAKVGRRVGPDDIGIRRQVLLCDTDAEAMALYEDLQEAITARTEDTFRPVMERLMKSGVGPAASVKQSGVIDAAAVPHAPEDAGKNVFERIDSAVRGADAANASAAPRSAPASGGGLVISEDEFITGSPETVAEQIIDQCRRLGAGNVMAYHVSTMSEAQIARNYALWEKTIPLLQKAKVLETATV